MVDDLRSKSNRGHRGGAVLVLLAIVAACAVKMVGSRAAPEPKPSPLSLSSSGVLPPGTGRERIADYLGPASCRECHPGESALSARSGHHRTLWRAVSADHPVIAWLDGKTVADPESPAVNWSYHLRGGKLVVDRTIDGRAESLTLDYGFGSGKHGATFVATTDGYFPGFDPWGVEHHLSYFADGPRLGITPGQDESDELHEGLEPSSFGRTRSPERVRKCFTCHSTLTSTLGRDRLEPATMVPNVSCERCHGPGREHVEAARRGETELTMRMGRDHPEPSVEVRLCGECHRLPETIPRERIRPENPGIVRFQSVGLSMSPCYGDGLRELRCTSCHDPHDRVSTGSASYEAVCLSCHGAASKQKACPVSPAADCIGCHMPRREVRGLGRFTDHWIRKPAPTTPDDAG